MSAPRQAAGRVAALVLAAGLSSRLAPAGVFKPLHGLGGSTLLARAAALFRSAGVEDILCVAGHRAREVEAEARRLGIACLENADYAQGMFSSVCAGLAALPRAFAAPPDRFFVLPVDIPLIRPASLRMLLGASEGTDVAALHPLFAGLRGHPPLIDARRIPDILAWAEQGGQGGLMGALAELEARFGAREVPVADRNILFDVDTPEALAEAEVRVARQGIPTRAEALALLRMHNAGERGLGHAEGVAAAALAMARALNARGHALDLELTESAALLHDIAKGQPRHEAAGAELLEGYGLPAAARIVEVHRDIAPADAPDAQGITERELVYLADKLVWGSQRVSVEARFGQKLEHFAGDAEACAAIRRRLGNALAMRARVEAAAGASLDEITLHAGGRA